MMESGLNFSPPQPLTFNGNVSNNWRGWKQELTLYLDATESSDKSDKVKSSIFLTCIGKKGLEIHNTFTFDSDGDNMKLDQIIQKFDSYCAPRKNLTFLRYTFLTFGSTMVKALMNSPPLFENCHRTVNLVI